MEERGDDPASRLKQAILTCQQIGKPLGSTAAGEVIHQALKTGSQAMALGLLLRLLEDTRAGIRALEGSLTVESYLVGIGPIDAWLGGINMRERWDSQSNVEPMALAALDTCSDQIWRSRKLRRMADEELTAWREEARGMLDEILESPADYTSEFREFLVSSLRGVVDAIDDYQITGSSRLADVVSAATGRMAVERPRPTNEADRTLYERFMRFCAAVVAGAGAIMAAAELPANVVDAYGHFLEEVHEVKELGPGALALPPGVGAESDRRGDQAVE